MATIEFYDRTMTETMGLLVEARRYLSDRAEADARNLTIDQGLASSVETMRLGRGSHFDPDVLDAFLSIESEFTRIAGRFADE